MGLTADAEFLLMLLPLVHVAWIDSHLHSIEAHFIKRVAKSHGLSPEAESILNGWLTEMPGHEFIGKGVRLLRELAQRRTGEVTPEHLQQLVVYANQVASSSGGVFNALFTINKSEQSLLNEIAMVFCVESIDWTSPGMSWDEIQDELQ